MKHQVIRFATHQPRLVFLITALMTLLIGGLIPLIDIDTDPENMLAADQPDRVFHNQVEARFGLHDAIVVGLVNETHPDGIYNVASLAALQKMSEAVLAIEGVIVGDVMSLALADNITQTDDGQLRFEWMMKTAPASAAEAQRIAGQVARLPLLQDTLAAGDGKAAAIYVPIASKDLSYEIAGQIESLAATLGGDGDEWHITGLPVAEDTFGIEMFIQMGISAPLAGLMIFLLLWYFFRSPRLIMAPMIVAMATVLITMGLMIGLGFTVHIMSSMIPIFLMPIAVVDSVHIMSEFADDWGPGKDPSEVIGGVVEHLFTPMLFTSLTSAIGFGSLLLTPIPPVQIFGAFVAIGILLAFVLTILFIPAYIVRMQPASLAKLGRAGEQHDAEIDTPLARLLRVGGRFAFGRSKLILGLTLVVFIMAGLGIARIQINDNPVRWFKADHRIRIADVVLNEHFAGTYDAFFVLEVDNSVGLEMFRDAAGEALAKIDAELPLVRDALDAPAQEAVSWFGEVIAVLDDAAFAAADDQTAAVLDSLLEQAERAQSDSQYFQSPAALRLIESLQQAMMAGGGVGKTNALPDIVKVVNRELRSGEDSDYAIPATQPGVAQALLQFQSSHRPQDLWHMVTPDYRSTAIWVQLTSGDNQDMNAVIESMNAYLVENPLPLGITGRWAGKTYINVIWQDTMVAGMLKSLLGAFIVVFVMMALLFRSIRFGLLAMLPLTATILSVYGLIGWAGKYYDMPVAVLSSLTLGLSVDFAIHFIQRMRSLYLRTGSFSAAAEQMFESPARAIMRNAIVIALGFTPLLLAPLVPYITVGVFMASIMAISGLATLVLLPAMMAVFRPLLFAEGRAQ